MTKYDGWELIGEPIGKGGQGTVYRARRPERVKQLEQIVASIEGLLRQAANIDKRTLRPEVAVPDLAQKIIEIGSPDPIEHLGALKQFAIPSDDKQEEARAIGRLESEVQALKKVNHPAVLKLLHSNVRERFIVTEYHQSGTLDKNLHRYQGNALAALQAFRKLVDGVVEIHKQEAIHRDIKPPNIFVGESGDLVLGDFGIVFLQEGGRQTTTFERVGSHFWMAPWAYKNERLALDEINPSLDIYPLGKVLWSMISGRNGFPYWEYDRGDNNLEEIFHGDPAMPLVNNLLAKCVVREETDCLPTAQSLLSQVTSLINRVKPSRGQRPEGADTWLCRVCGRGTYGASRASLVGLVPGAGADRISFAVYRCSYCLHAELFSQT